MGMLYCLNSIFTFSHITQVSVPEFVIDGHYYTSPNQQEEPPTISFSHSEPLPDNALPSQLRKRVWALQHYPYLPFVLFSPFHGSMTSRFATPPELIPLEEDKYGHHLPQDVAKSWKTLEQSCCRIATLLRTLFEKDHPKTPLNCSVSPSPSNFGYSKAYLTEKKARSALSESVDAFVLLFAYVSFFIAMCRVRDDPATVSLSPSSTNPRWFRHLSSQESRIHPEWLQLLADSPISDFTSTTTPQRVGTIINVSQCSWIHLVPRILMANVPIWLYWGIPPLFVQPLDTGALHFAPRAHPQSRAPPLPAITPSQSVNLPTQSQSVGLPTQSQPVGLPTQSQSVGLPVRSAHAGPASAQRPGETWKDFMARQNIRRKAKILKENDVERHAREDRENTAAKRSCPGKKGPTVFVWEEDGGVWTRTLITRKQVEDYWGNFKSFQKIYNSIDNCWDLCSKFNEGTAGEMYEYDSNDSDNDAYRPKQSRRSPTPKACSPRATAVDSESTLQSSDCTPMVVDTTPPQISSSFPLMRDSSPAQIPDPSPMIIDPSPTQISSVPPPVPVHPAQHEDDFNSSDEEDEDPYDASRKDVLNAYSVALDLEEMPVTTLDDLLYYRYGFSLNESPYTGIPSSVTERRTFRSWTEVCRTVGGQQLEASAVDPVDRRAIEDFLSILAGSPDPFIDVPGKYWDLSPSGHSPIVDLDKVFISIEERQFTVGKRYIIRPRFLHPSRDTSWLLSVDPMTALECIRRGLGPHTIDIANSLISHGVHFRTLQHIPNSSNSEQLPVRPHCRYLGYRSVDYSFDLADFAGYEALRDSFLRSQSHGPLALREGGIVARLAREVLPNSNALSGPSSDALSGHRARYICGDEIYVDDSFLEVELGLICGTYVLGNAKAKGGNEIFFF